MTLKVCKDCGIEKELKYFSPHKTGKMGYYTYCKPCACIRASPRKSHRARNWVLRSKYGIGLEDYNKMFANQSGQCKICSIHQSELKEPLCVDHCHTTGKVRGLLCRACNSGIGQLGDSFERVLKAARYLKIGR